MFEKQNMKKQKALTQPLKQNVALLQQGNCQGITRLLQPT